MYTQVPVYRYKTVIWYHYTSQTVKYRESSKMTNLGTVVYIGTLYEFDVFYIALSCAFMTPLEIQPLTTYHNDHIWLSRTVQRCIYAISSSDMTDGDSLGQCICRLWYGITSCNSSINI